VLWGQGYSIQDKARLIKTRDNATELGDKTFELF